MHVLYIKEKVTCKNKNIYVKWKKEIPTTPM